MARQGDNFYLVITDTVTDDSGIFMANANNSSGDAKSYSRLAVTKQQTSSSDGSTFKQVQVENSSSSGGKLSSGQPPEFKKLFYNKHVKIGDDLRIDAVILGSPKPKVI